MPALAPGAVVRLNRAFPYDTRQQMLNVHQFFVKAFGCLVIEGSLPVDIGGFAGAIMNNRAHPLVHLKFGVPSAGTKSPPADPTCGPCRQAPTDDRISSRGFMICRMSGFW